MTAPTTAPTTERPAEPGNAAEAPGTAVRPRRLGVRRGPGGRWRRRAVRAPRAPRQRRPFEVTGAAVVAAGLLVLTTLILLFGAYLFVGSSLAAGRHQDVLYAELRTQLAQATVPVSGPIPTGTPLGLVEIPRVGLEQVFVEGSASEQTLAGPGLRHDSVLPGQAGVSVLVGRRATFGSAFGDLDRMRPGDRILVTTGQGRFTYVVDLVRTSDAPPARIQQVPARLTLVTSDPAIAPDRSLQVSARLDGQALPASTGTATVPDDVPGQGSSGRSVALLLWTQLLLVVTALVTWAALRLPGRAVWIGAVPVLLAVLWNVFENLAVLLPNTL
ncbi:MAG: sortase domain-containing protein [Nocardioides sp.]